MLPVWDLKVRRPSVCDWDVVALFNWSETEAPVGFDFSELGLDRDAEYALYEFWTSRFQGVRKGRFEMPVPGHGVRLLAVHRKQPNPQFLSSDRHIAQGAVELSALSWDATAKALTGSVKAVKGSPLKLRFLVPAGFKHRSTTAKDGVTCQSSGEEGGLLAVTLTSPVTQDVPFTIAWE